MKKFLAVLAAIAVFLCACNEDTKSTWEEYAVYREANEAWLTELQAKTNPDGSPYYTKVVAPWDENAYVLMHFFNDRMETAGNLSPMYTSTVDTRYYVRLYDGTPVDSSATITSTGVKGIYRSQLKTNIMGWSIALPKMRCGDTAEIITPYEVAYGVQDRGVVKPYSALQFNVRLVDIPFYEKAPYE